MQKVNLQKLLEKETQAEMEENANESEKPMETQEPTSTESTDEKKPTDDNPSEELQSKTTEFLSINELLRREIFELRHEREVLKESFRDY